MNPIDFVDVIGQIYKARTGEAPTAPILDSAKQMTAKGELGKAYTFILGDQAPGTTKDIMNSLKETADSMGNQADTFHEGYMKSHSIQPYGLKDEIWNQIKNTERGLSFKEATAKYRKSQDAGANFEPDVVAYAKTHNITPQKAQQIKAQRTSNGVGR